MPRTFPTRTFYCTCAKRARRKGKTRVCGFVRAHAWDPRRWRFLAIPFVEAGQKFLCVVANPCPMQNFIEA